MQLLLQQDWIPQVARKEALFRELLVHPSIKAVRSCGLLIAVEFASHEINKKTIAACLRSGLLTDWFLFAPQCMRIAPPLPITEDQIARACAIILSCIA